MSSEQRVRASELGITIGRLERGPLNAITDVAGSRSVTKPSSGATEISKSVSVRFAPA